MEVAQGGGGCSPRHRHEARGADTRSLAAVGALERGDPPSPRHGGSNPDPGENILAGGAQLAGRNEANSAARQGIRHHRRQQKHNL